MTCGASGECETTTESAMSVANAKGTVDGAPVFVTVLKEDGTSCEQGSCAELPIGSRVTFIVPNAPGHRFVGWSGSPECVGESLELVVRSLQTDTECVAHYVRRIRVSALDPTGASGLTARSTSPYASCAQGSCEVDVGSTVVLSASERSGTRFLGWTGDSCVSRSLELSVVADAADVTCQANYVQRLSVVASAAGAEAAIAVEGGGETALCSGASCTVDQGASVQLTAPTVPGLRFAGWSGSAACRGDGRVLVLDEVRSNEACTGTYVPRRRVAATARGPAVPPLIQAVSEDAFASCLDGVCEVDAGGSVTLVAPSADGYRLAGWLGDACEGEVASTVLLTAIERDLSCVADYAQGISVGGSLIGAPGQVTASSPSSFARCDRGTCVIDAGGTVALVAPTLPERRFMGWEGDPGCQGQQLALRFDNVTASKTCYARYATRFQVRGVVTPESAGSVRASSRSAATSCVAEACTVDAGATVTLEAQAAEGSRFAGWSGGGACAGRDPVLSIASVAGNLRCTANFVSRLLVTGSANPPAGGSVATTSTSAEASCVGASCTVDLGATVVLTATAAEGYRFEGWSGCGTSGAPELTLASLQQAALCVANFAQLRYVVSSSAMPREGGSVTATSASAGAECAQGRCSVAYGGAVELEAAPALGYTFAGWSGCVESAEARLVRTNVAGDQLCAASFTRIQLEVSGAANPLAGGSVAASSSAPGAACTGSVCTVPHGSAATLQASPAASYRFAGWSGCGDGSENPLLLPSISAATRCTANFSRVTHTVAGSAAPPASGSVSASSASPRAVCQDASCVVEEGASVTLTATPAEGHRFVDWSECPFTAPATIALADVRAEVRCRANFARIRHRVSGVVAPSGSGVVVASSEDAGAVCADASCTVDQGGRVALVATPARGFAFRAWSDCPVTGGPSIVLPDVAASTACTANFAPILRTVTLRPTPAGFGTILGAACTGLLCSVEDGSPLELTAEPARGHRFVGWSDCSNSTAAQLRLDSVTRDLTCTASFAIDTVSITVTRNNEGGTIAITSPEPACRGAVCTRTVDLGSPVTITAQPNTGFAFSAWSGCPGAGSAATATIDVGAALTCTANFVPSYNVGAVAMGDHGEGYYTLEPGAAEVVATSSTAGSTCRQEGATGACVVPAQGSVSMVANATNGSGYRFLGWTCPNNNIESSARTLPITNVAADTVCIARFAAPLTYGVAGYGYIGESYRPNEVSVTAASASRWADCAAGNFCNVLPQGSVTLTTTSRVDGIAFRRWECRGQGGLGASITYTTSSVTFDDVDQGWVCNAYYATVSQGPD